MRVSLAFVTVLLVSFLVVPLASATESSCNLRCDFDSDCSAGYRCYVGVCRLDACPASSTCSCGVAQSQQSPTPRPTTQSTPTPTASLRPTSTASPSAKPLATTAAQLKETPKTGFGVIELAILAVGLFLMGGMIMGSSLFTSKSPVQIISSRKERKQSTQ